MIRDDESESEKQCFIHRGQIFWLSATNTRTQLVAKQSTARDVHTTDDPAVVVSPSCDAD